MLVPSIYICILRGLDGSEYESFAFDFDAHDIGGVAQLIDAFFILFLILFPEVLHLECREPEEPLSDVIEDGDGDGAAVVCELEVGIVLDADDAILALEALGGDHVDLLLAEVAVLEDHLLLADLG